MGREINHGIIPLVLLRLFRYGKARIEDKLMDEHIYLTEGTTADMTYPFYNASLMTLTEWTAKHNWYATREAIELLTIECQKHSPQQILNIGTHSAGVRAKKLKYARLPLFWRAFALFVYRYFFRLGFLDGKEGFLWHFLEYFQTGSTETLSLDKVPVFWEINCQKSAEVSLVKYLHE